MDETLRIYTGQDSEGCACYEIVGPQPQTRGFRIPVAPKAPVSK